VTESPSRSKYARTMKVKRRRFHEPTSLALSGFCQTSFPSYKPGGSWICPASPSSRFSPQYDGRLESARRPVRTSVASAVNTLFWGRSRSCQTGLACLRGNAIGSSTTRWMSNVYFGVSWSYFSSKLTLLILNVQAQRPSPDVP
jgi:hypothetical protein